MLCECGLHNNYDNIELYLLTDVTWMPNAAST